MKKILVMILAALTVLALCACGSKTAGSTGDTQAKSEPAAQASEEASQKDETFQKVRHAEITVKDYGTIKLELDEGTAPITVANFIKLAKDGFYDGLTFHRIMDGFMIQGGDPEGTGMGGSDQTITGEFANNGIPNDISHVRGVISMARNGYDMNSASSQFFIVQTDSTFLDGDYAGFGHVTDGMDIVDSICADTVNTDNNGGVAPGDQPVITEVRVID